MSFGDRYVLAKAVTPMTARLHGTYDVIIVGAGDPLNETLWEIVEEGSGSSAAEWMRLLDLRDSLRIVHEVLES